ncbi:MAG: DMT family transporter [Candidatus Kryptoniota bacterium]
MTESPSKLKLISGYLLICLIWSTTWLGIKISTFSFPPFFSAGFRFMIATALLLIILKVKKFKYKFNIHELIFLVLVGLGSFSIPYGLVYWAEQRLASGLTAVTFAVMPFFAAILSSIFLKTDRLTLQKTLGIVIGFAGLTYIFWGDLKLGSLDTVEGMTAVVCSSFLNASVAVSVKRYGKNIDPVYINLVPMLFGGITLLLSSALLENWKTVRFDLFPTLSVLYLAVFGSVTAFVIYFYLLKHMSVVLLSMTSFITPVLALFFGYVTLNENLPAGTLLGAALILSGVLIFSTGKDELAGYLSHKDVDKTS